MAAPGPGAGVPYDREDFRLYLQSLKVATVDSETTRTEGPFPSDISGRDSLQKMKEAATEFLTQRRVAVTGVSKKNPQAHGSNVVYRRLRDRGYQVFAINPNADEVEGDRCYHDLKSVPGELDWVVIGTRPETADATMHECVDLGIDRVWMHRALGTGSVSKEAAEYGRRHGVTVIDGGCPCMFEPAADPGHKVMRAMLTLTGKVPRKVESS